MAGGRCPGRLHTVCRPKVGFDASTFWNFWSNPLWEKFWPTPWDWVLDRHNVLDPLVETLQIAVVSTLIGCTLALPLAFAMSPLTSPNRVTLVVSRSAMNVVRAVPDLFWAKLLVTAVGVGAFAGSWALSVFPLGVMVKLFSETIDGADPRPWRRPGRPAAATVPWSGPASSHRPSRVRGLRAVRVRVEHPGIGGAGPGGRRGIGRVVEAQRQYFRFDRVLGVLVRVFCGRLRD
ncbi:MAG: hypothetical protein Ct9H300mP31_11030 [Acidimicrobiaceae bacterium]|nr:MAG: hypothetical protein Ct9H300mP31_11030 [Acidimicrobiaceae bacterium]